MYQEREFDKLNFRYPGAGESYTDVMQRVSRGVCVYMCVEGGLVGWLVG